VDLESVDVDDGLGHVGEHGSEIVDPLSDRRWTVAHHETNSLILVKKKLNGGQIVINSFEITSHPFKIVGKAVFLKMGIQNS
jgi:hypothetical protein